METNIISVKYEENFAPTNFGGRPYSYLTSIKLKVGDLVIAPTATGDKIAKVSEINVPEDKVRLIKPYLKTIMKKINTEKYLQSNVILVEVA